MKAESPFSRVTVEDVARYPYPGQAIPNTFAFSPDDRLLTYLYSPAGTLTQHLFICDTQTGARREWLSPAQGGETEATLSPEEKLRRERARSLAVGVTRYAWGADRTALVPLNGDVYLLTEASSELSLLVAHGEAGPLLDPRFSPDGRWVAYVQDAELHVIAAAGGAPQRLTWDARGTGRTNGLAEFAAQEELDRAEGYWWSPDSAWLAFAAVDETHIPLYRIMHQGKDALGEAAQEDHAYPFAGQPNARVRLGLLPVTGGAPRWLDLGDFEYLACVAWFPDGALAVQTLNREQTELHLWRFDPATGQGETLLVERNPVWINLHSMFHPLRAGGFIWAAERDGFMHFYRYDAQGNCSQLTQGEWMVDSLEGVDEERGWLYFCATKEHPTERHLYVVPLTGGEPRAITSESGAHRVKLDRACRRFVDVYSALDHPPTVTLRALENGAELLTVHAVADPAIETLGLRPPGLIEFKARDGVTLYGALYVPDDQKFGPGPYPTIVSVYGGPHAQRVAHSWDLAVDMRAQYLRSLGFLVFRLDNRGSARRGLAFEGAIKQRMGDLEVRDQVDGVQWLVTQGLTDPKRVGIYGWSYGGYMAAMCLARAPETFAVAVAGAPVTAWDGYDTAYTERYMGTPQSNPEGYRLGSVMTHVDNLQGKLLLVHGLIDENVHFRHTARLINALIHARKPYDLLLFPDERHSPRSLADRIYMEERICDYFMAHL